MGLTSRSSASQACYNLPAVTNSLFVCVYVCVRARGCMCACVYVCLCVHSTQTHTRQAWLSLIITEEIKYVLCF